MTTDETRQAASPDARPPVPGAAGAGPDPDAADRAAKRVREHFARKDVPGTLAAAELLHRLAPTRLVESWGHCGLVLRYAGRPGEAVPYFERVVGGAGGDPLLPGWVFTEFCAALGEAGDWERAFAVASGHIRRHPTLCAAAVRARLRADGPAAARAWLSGAIDALAGDPDASSLILPAAEALFAADRTEESLQVLRKAARTFPGAGMPAALAAEAALERGDPAEACRLHVEAALARHGGHLAALGALASVVRAHPGLHRAHLGDLARLLRENPDGTDVVHAVLDYLTIAMPRAEALDWLVDAAAAAPRLLPALSVELVRWGLFDRLKDRCARQIDAWQRSATHRDADRFLDALCHFRPVEPGLLARVAAMPQPRWRVFWLLRCPASRILPLRDAQGADAALAGEAGLAREALATCFERLTAPALPAYDAYLDEADVSGTVAREAIRRKEAECAFQDIVVRERAFVLPDPWSGSPCELFDSVKVFDRQVFSFRGRELFAFISGGNMNAGAFVHLVGQNLLLRIDTAASPCSQAYYGSASAMADLMGLYMERAARGHASYLAAASEAPGLSGTPREVVAVHGRAENPAHHSWNYLSPFERLRIAGLLGNISAVVAPPTRYFGEVGALYPELAHVPSLDLPERAAIDPFPFSPRHVVLQLGGNFIQRGLKARLEAWARAEAGAERVSGIEARCASHDPVVWLALRVGDKVWVDQEAGLSRLINAVLERHPGAVFLLDSFSLPAAGAAVPDKWAPQVEELRGIAARIRAAAARPDSVLDLTGNTLAESLVWASRTTAYFAPLGSSQHKVGWYGPARGVVYTTERNAVAPWPLRVGAWEAEGSPPPRYLVGAVAEPGRKRGHFDFRSNLENVAFDAAEAAEALLALL